MNKSRRVIATIDDVIARVGKFQSQLTGHDLSTIARQTILSRVKT